MSKKNAHFVFSGVAQTSTSNGPHSAAALLKKACGVVHSSVLLLKCTATSIYIVNVYNLFGIENWYLSRYCPRIAEGRVAPSGLDDWHCILLSFLVFTDTLSFTTLRSETRKGHLTSEDVNTDARSKRQVDRLW